MGGDAEYKAYLDMKEKTLNGIRSTLVRTYTDLFFVYRDLGYSEKTADSMATAAALETKKAIMPVYETLFPNSGKKVKKVY